MDRAGQAQNLRDIYHKQNLAEHISAKGMNTNNEKLISCKCNGRSYRGSTRINFIIFLMNLPSY